MQKHHDLADDLLIGPAGGDLLRPLLADAVDFPQPRWRLFNHFKNTRTECLYQPSRINGADALYHAGAEVALDAGQGVGRRDFDEDGAELPAVLTVDDPIARC